MKKMQSSPRCEQVPLIGLAGEKTTVANDGHGNGLAGAGVAHKCGPRKGTRDTITKI